VEGIIEKPLLLLLGKENGIFGDRRIRGALKSNNNKQGNMLLHVFQRLKVLILSKSLIELLEFCLTNPCQK